MESGDVTQGGGVGTSGNFRNQMVIGQSLASVRLTSSRFHILPGLLGQTLSSPSAPPLPQELELGGLYAKASPTGETLTPSEWQKDKDPIFIWEPPTTGPEVAGYSYSLDGALDDTVDTSGTSFDVAPNALTDGKHIFSVKAINTLGTAGKPLSIEIWVDSTAPQITGYSPAPGALLNTKSPSVTATVLDVASGVDPVGTTLSINGSPVSTLINAQTGMITATGGHWKEGSNSVELRVEDLVGNTLPPLVWSLTIDTLPPTGTVAINADSGMTTSVYVTLALSASDAISGVKGILISNEALTGFVEEPYVTLREFWKLTPIRGTQKVYVKFVDQAGNVSEPVSDEIDLVLLSPETMITSGPAGFAPDRQAPFTFMCPEGNCLFSFAFDGEGWSSWSSETSAAKADLSFGNHYFRVKAAKDVNGTPGIQLDEEDPSPAERTWIVGVAPSILTIPKGAQIKMWRLE